jgi:hypothetical protein
MSFAHTGAATSGLLSRSSWSRKKNEWFSKYSTRSFGIGPVRLMPFWYHSLNWFPRAAPGASFRSCNGRPKLSVNFRPQRDGMPALRCSHSVRSSPSRRELHARLLELRVHVPGLLVLLIHPGGLRGLLADLLVVRVLAGLRLTTCFAWNGMFLADHV